MEEFSIFDHSMFKCQNLNLEQLDDFDSPVFSISLSNSIIFGNGGAERIFNFNDQNHLITYVEEDFFVGKEISIDREYYLQNKEIFDQKICKFLSTNNSDHIKLCTELINEDYIRAISMNPNIKTLYLGSFFDQYILTNEIYDILRNSSVESIHSADSAIEIRDIFGEKINCNDTRNLIGDCNYQSLIKQEQFKISHVLSEEEISYLKYLKKDCEVTFANSNDYENVSKAIDVIRANGNNTPIKINVQYLGEYSYKNEFNDFVAKHPEIVDKNIIVRVGISEEYSLKDYINYEKKLYDLIKDAYNLSPFERYLYAYNVVKKYKRYKENEENREEARHLYDLLDNEYMVCVGYSNLLGDLLEKLGIESQEYKVSVDIGFDSVPNDVEIIPDDVEVESAGHERRMVHIVDPKYDIDGIFYTDPTWDNVMESDTYNYSLMTQEEYLGINRYDYYKRNYVSEIFFSKTIDEFYYKANHWIDDEVQKKEQEFKKSQNYYANSFNKDFLGYVELLKGIDESEYNNVKLLFGNLFKTQTIPPNAADFIRRQEKYLLANNNSGLNNQLVKVSADISCFEGERKKYLDANIIVQKAFIKEMVDSLKLIDNKKYNYYKKKFEDVYEKDFVPDDYYISSAMFDIGEYIVNKVNNKVTGEKYKAAITELYSKCYGVSDEDLEEEVSKTMLINRNRQLKCFPVRYEVTEDSKIPILNEDNKFEIEGMDLVA